ncbi:aspartic peptidase domain-containing protein [Dissophora ornata]|nr:aspartic peptidase domain-containing protein [Dissophora ornata]
MKLSLGIASALALVATQTANAANLSDVLKIPITTVHGARRPSTVGRWVHTLRKYGISGSRITGGAKGMQRFRLVGGDEVGVARIPLVDFEFDREYFGTVMVGEPLQAFKIDFDTGSSKFILSSKGCNECSGTTRYDPSASHSFRLNSDYENGLNNNYNYSNNNSNNSNSNNNNNNDINNDINININININSNNSSSTSVSADPSFPTISSSNSWHITYSDLSHAEGYLGRDHVQVGNIAVLNQQLALVTSESANFDDMIDGVMGLAFGALSPVATTASDGLQKTMTVFENMMDQKLVSRGVFSFYLGKNPRNSNSSGTDNINNGEGGGEVIFGGIDESRVREGYSIVYTNVTKPKYWQINVENVLVAGKRADFSTSRTSTFLTPANNVRITEDNVHSNIAGIMDTGTTLMIVPERLCSAIHALIPGAVKVYGQSWALPCDLTDMENKVELEIEGHRFAIPFEDLVREEVEQDKPEGSSDGSEGTEGSNSFLSAFDRSKEGSSSSEQSKLLRADSPTKLCFSGIQPSSAYFMIIGDLFIKNNYVVFDQENQRVGIAPLRFASKESSLQSKDKDEGSRVKTMEKQSAVL